MYTAIVLLIAMLSALWGWCSGVLNIALRLSVLLLAYVLAWQETPALAHWLADKAWLPELLVWPVAGLTLFLGGSMLFAIAARWLGFLVPEEWHNKGKSAGAMAGVLLGAGLGLLMVWTVGVLQDSRALHRVAPQHGDGAENPATIERADNLVRDMSGQAMAVMVKGALGDSSIASVATHWVKQPLSLNEGLRHLVSKPELQQLFGDPDNYVVLVRGSNTDIQSLPAFQALTDDQQVMQLLSVAGLPGDTPLQQSQALAGMLSRYSGNFEKLRATPEFQALVQDPELQTKWQQGNLLALLTDDKIRRLTHLLAQGGLLDPLPVTSTSHGAHAVGIGEKNIPRELPSEFEQASPVKPLYRWQDDKGRMHITEDQPPEGIKADVIQL